MSLNGFTSAAWWRRLAAMALLGAGRHARARPSAGACRAWADHQAEGVAGAPSARMKRRSPSVRRIARSCTASCEDAAGVRNHRAHATAAVRARMRTTSTSAVCSGMKRRQQLMKKIATGPTSNGSSRTRASAGWRRRTIRSSRRRRGNRAMVAVPGVGQQQQRPARPAARRTWRCRAHGTRQAPEALRPSSRCSTPASSTAIRT